MSSRPVMAPRFLIHRLVVVALLKALLEILLAVLCWTNGDIVGHAGVAVVKKQGASKKAATKEPSGPRAKVDRNARTGLLVSRARFEAVMQAAEHSGLLGEKSKLIGGRISPELIEQAKKHTGIETDTDLIEFALANVALDDNFGAPFRETRGTVDPDLKLGF